METWGGPLAGGALAAMEWEDVPQQHKRALEDALAEMGGYEGELFHERAQGVQQADQGNRVDQPDQAASQGLQGREAPPPTLQEAAQAGAQSDQAAGQQAGAVQVQQADQQQAQPVQRPSQALGLDASRGSLSAAAVVAVDGGASPLGQQVAAQMQAEQQAVRQSEPGAQQQGPGEPVAAGRADGDVNIKALGKTPARAQMLPGAGPAPLANAPSDSAGMALSQGEASVGQVPQAGQALAAQPGGLEPVGQGAERAGAGQAGEAGGAADGRAGGEAAQRRVGHAPHSFSQDNNPFAQPRPGNGQPLAAYTDENGRQITRGPIGAALAPETVPGDGNSSPIFLQRHWAALGYSSDEVALQKDRLYEKSWVLLRKSDGALVQETDNPLMVLQLNRAKYAAVPVGDYYARMNKRIQQGKRGGFGPVSEEDERNFIADLSALRALPGFLAELDELNQPGSQARQAGDGKLAAKTPRKARGARPETGAPAVAPTPETPARSASTDAGTVAQSPAQGKPGAPDLVQVRATNGRKYWVERAALATGELSRLIPDLIEALGGEMNETGEPGSAAPPSAPPASAPLADGNKPGGRDQGPPF